MTNDNSLVRMQLEDTLDATSLRSLARAAEVVMLAIDTSGSMATMDLPNGKSRIDGLREVVTNIKATGSVPTIAFGGPYDAQVRFVDEVPAPDGGTPMHLAIPFAKQYGATRLVMVSDGQPDLVDATLDAARTFGGQIDIVYVGPEDRSASTFMNELARITGGTTFSGSLADPKQLSGRIIGLLEGPKDADKAPLQGTGFAIVPDAPDADDDSDDDEDGDEDEEGDDDDDADEQ
jgi:hypothetical protein